MIKYIPYMLYISIRNLQCYFKSKFSTWRRFMNDIININILFIYLVTDIIYQVCYSDILYIVVYKIGQQIDPTK